MYKALKFIVFPIFMLGLSIPTFSLDYPLNITPQADYTVCQDMLDREWYNISYEAAKKKNSVYVTGQDAWLFKKRQDLTHNFTLYPKNIDVFKSIQERLSEQNIDLVLVFLPTRGHFAEEKVVDGQYENYDFNKSIDNYKKMLVDIRQQGFYVPDLSQFKTHSGSETLTFFRDHHWNPQGSKIIAKLTADYIKKQPFYNSLEKTTFKTSIKGIYTKEGTYNRLVRTTCGNQIQSQKVPLYVTESAESDADDLFSDNTKESSPEVVLIGTSNSDKYYNFSGFLQEYLSTQVLNVSIIGGGLEQSFYEYLKSDHYQTTPPKLIIWEIPSGSYLPMRDKLNFTKLLEFSGYGCKSNSLINNKIALHEGNNEILLNKDNLTITSTSNKNYTMIDFRFSDSNKMEKIKLTAWYMNGSKKSIPIELKHIEDNRFITELPKMKDNASFLLLEALVKYKKDAEPRFSGQKTSLDISMCKVNK